MDREGPAARGRDPRGYLVRRADCEAFAKPKPGRPPGPRRAKGSRAGRRPASPLLRLAEFGLMTVKQFAAYHRRAEQTVLRWLAEGRLAAVPTPSAHLLRRSDCEAFRPPKMGAPSWADGARR